jgi:hypothetical protein
MKFNIDIFKSSFMSLTGLALYMNIFHFVAPKHRVPTDQSSHNWYRCLE